LITAWKIGIRGSVIVFLRFINLFPLYGTSFVNEDTCAIKRVSENAHIGIQVFITTQVR
jgi:hypothetical protein